MLDFISVKKTLLKDRLLIEPEFVVKKSKDLMIRGKAFYAIWDEKEGLWSTDEQQVVKLVDDILYEEAEKTETFLKKDIKLLKNFSSNKWSEWQKYCKSLTDNYHELDHQVLFSNEEVKKKDYATFTLPYPIKECETPCYEELMATLYDPCERQKIEWAIGAIISGDSKKLQKFLVFYGAPGTGKSTILNIVQEMFKGYYSLLEARDLTSGSQFGLESLKNNSLLAIQHDGDLSRIEDNTKLNSVVSHEELVVNEKFKSMYSVRFQSFLWIGTNKPVRITDSKSGVIRRLIDVEPTGEKIPVKRYRELMKGITFEYPGIAWRCLKVYEELGFKHYDSYIAESMLLKTNDIYNFIDDNYDLFESVGEEGIVLNTLWARYKEYCIDANIQYPMYRRVFKDEMKNYFGRFEERIGGRRSVYFDFLAYKFKNVEVEAKEGKDEDTIFEVSDWLLLKEQDSKLDAILSECPAQYVTLSGSPKTNWENCKTKLKDLDTRNVHFLRPPKNLITIDFDLKNEKGEKDRKRNLKAASKWPPTYAEVSKSGAGIHLEYYYEGDVDQLSYIYEPGIEVKASTGKSALRRKLTLCNDLDVATIHSGLPLKEEKRVLKDECVKSEKALRDLIERNLRKEIHPNTKPSMDFIKKILDDAYESGLSYDVTDLRPAIQAFALKSSNNVDYCLRLIGQMEFQSETYEESERDDIFEDVPIVFYDVEVFPNLFVVCWKKKGKDAVIVKWINPTPEQMEELMKFRLIGFNNRDYDNHIIWARRMGYDNYQLYRLSQAIIGKDKDARFAGAYGISYTDVYDYLSPPNRAVGGLKKWEIKLGIHHNELGLPWSEPVDESLWKKVADYCGDDVLATEAVFDATQDDFKVRQILAKWAGCSVNEKTNTLAKRIIFGNDKHPQNQFIYTDLSKEFPGYRYDAYGIPKEEYKIGTKIVQGKSIYRGEDPSEGGYVYAEPGMYKKVALLDVESVHPNSVRELKCFGEKYTKVFCDILDGRLAIKHGDIELAKKILPKEVHEYLEGSPEDIKALSGGLKGVVNPVYGLTSAKFPNEFKDPRNVDNIVAKRGALFMIDLKHAVQEQGFTVAHIKTDSIKIPDATPEIIEFVKEFGKKYGYTFEHEATYEKMCLVNDAVYIAKYEKPKIDKKTGREIWWTATGDQFKVPYVFKTLFSGEEIEFSDVCETISVTDAALYLDYNEALPDVRIEEAELKKLEGKYKKGLLSDTTFESECAHLNEIIKTGHDYRFVGKVGCFLPVKDGVGGGVLLRKGANGKYTAPGGTLKPNKKDPYKFMETEMAKENWMDVVDLSYHNHLVDKAVETIEKYGDFEWFVSDDLGFPMNPPEEELPFE